ncbi:YaaC family protein [Caballeronia sp. SEWSISQ10-4 2]|uniref:YaaC family protein n=1 Tax=Caballeronia sp. SEWSISQ10-4 2 TaxID=2937438 RepID=UPI00264C61A6|nr:YaaC family protein [Caballeronia sp. SEWSISQ10-4 2]MDN7179089.1 YaaC family protein [Caballeronia sp. SEWSISQ10-4 2]
MDAEIWQQLLSFESRDVISRWFEKIHGRQLSARRAKEINAAAKQAREYFRNASSADYSVRPLLTFYGVASLSRSLLLLLQSHNGEEVLTKGHGLETVGWSSVITDANGLSNALDLKVKTCGGLFYDLLVRTKNRTSIHVRSSAVDWRISYDVPESGDEISLGDLFARIPDLEKDYEHASDDAKYAWVHDVTFNPEAGFTVRVNDKNFLKFKEVYDACGYTSVSENGMYAVTGDAKIFESQLPLFIHTYIQKNFGAIPRLYLTSPFQSGARYSQLCITYIVSYIIGMLVRYYPTQWISLIQGEKGDKWWPSINRAQQFVEKSYPELVVELLMDILNTQL